MRITQVLPMVRKMGDKHMVKPREYIIVCASTVFCARTLPKGHGESSEENRCMTRSLSLCAISSFTLVRILKQDHNLFTNIFRVRKSYQQVHGKDAPNHDVASIIFKLY